MQNETLQKLIARQNERLEEDATQKAAKIINEIAELQQAKIDAEAQIQELREQLKKIQIPQLDPTSILGN